VVEAMITPTSIKVRQPLPTLGFTVPLPPPALSPNKGWGGARMKALAKSVYRQSCFTDARNAVRAAGWEAPECVTVSLVFYTKGAKGKFYQPRDDDNALASFKAGRDGIVSAGVAKGDARKHWLTGSIQIDSSRGPWVDVFVEVNDD
jgi:hypothetical protein